MRLLLALANIHYEMAELPALLTVASTLQQLADQTGSGLSVAWAHRTLGWVHYQRNELTSAAQCFRKLAPVAHARTGRAVFDGYTGLVLQLWRKDTFTKPPTDIAILRKLLLERGMLASAHRRVAPAACGAGLRAIVGFGFGATAPG